jgi:hypothetical protein
LGTKWEIWDFGWLTVGGYDGERPTVVFWWWGKWMPEVGFGFKGGFEVGNGEGLVRALYDPRERMGKKEEK